MTPWTILNGSMLWRRYNGYKKTVQQRKQEVYEISKNDVKWLFAHCQVFVLNWQNIITALLQMTITKELMAWVKSDLIDMPTKLNRKFASILHLNDHFFKFSIFYSKAKGSQILHTISAYLHDTLAFLEYYNVTTVKNSKRFCFLFWRSTISSSSIDVPELLDLKALLSKKMW